MSDRRTLPTVHIGLIAVAVLAVLVLPYFSDSTTLRVLTTAGLYAYLAQSWNIVGGYGGMFSLGHPVFFAIGGYTSALLLLHASVSPWLGMLVGAFLAAAVAAGLTAVTVRFRVSGVYFALLTLAAWTVLLAVVSVSDELGRANGLLLPLDGGFAELTFTDPYGYYAVVVVMVVLLTFAVWRLSRSRLGRALTAQREDPLAARASGVQLAKVRTVAMMFSAAATALGGAFAVQYYHFATPSTLLSFDVTLQMLLGTLIGGAATVFGPLAGALIFALLAELLRSIPALAGGSQGAVFTTMVYAALLILTTLLAPKGLVPTLGKRLPARWRPRQAAEPRTDSTVTSVRPRQEASAQDGPPLLDVRGMSKRIGGLQVLNDVSLTVGHGQALGLIGPNGAGKTTLFNCVSGFMRPTEGTVWLRGQDVTGARPEDLCRAGMARTFQITKPFPEMTAVETVRLALEQSGVTRQPFTAMDILELVRFQGDTTALGGSLSVVNRKRLEVARALAGSPDLLLLDEVCAGLAPAEVDEIVEVLAGLRDQGVSLLMIEHVLPAVFSISDSVAVLSQGEIIASGSAREVTAHPAVVAAYLGSSSERAAATTERAEPAREELSEHPL